MNRTRVLVSAGPSVPVALLRRVAEGTLRSLRAPAGHFSITCVDGRTMRGLNRRYLGHDCVTDVLSFDYRSGLRPARSVAKSRDSSFDLRQRGLSPLLGEVIIAPSVARRQARRFGQTYQRELARYVIHGLLHWAGYDDRAAAQRRRMKRKQEALLNRLMPAKERA